MHDNNPITPQQPTPDPSRYSRPIQHGASPLFSPEEARKIRIANHQNNVERVETLRFRSVMAIGFGLILEIATIMLALSGNDLQKLVAIGTGAGSIVLGITSLAILRKRSNSMAITNFVNDFSNKTDITKIKMLIDNEAHFIVKVGCCLLPVVFIPFVITVLLSNKDPFPRKPGAKMIEMENARPKKTK